MNAIDFNSTGFNPYQFGAYGVLLLLVVFGAKVLLPKILNDFRNFYKLSFISYIIYFALMEFH